MQEAANINTSVFPDRFASKKTKKDKPYGMQYAKAIWSEHTKNAASYNDLQELFRDNRRYAEGLQDIDKYKNQLNLLSGDLSWLNLDFSPVNRLAALVDNLQGKMMNQLYKIQCNPIDIASQTQQDKDRKKLDAAMFLRKNASDIEQMTGLPVYPRDVKLPDTDEETELFFKMNYKQACAIAMEQAMAFVFMNNNFDSVTREKIIRDLIVNKRACVQRYYDENRNIRIKYVDHVKVITPYSSSEDFDNIPYIAVIDDLTIGDIAQMTDEFDDAQLLEIAQKFQGKQGNPMINDNLMSYEGYYNSNSGFVRPWENFNVQVLSFYFLSICKENRVKTTKDGRIYWDAAGEDYVPKAQNKESIQKNIQYVFEGKWIIGSDYLFNYKMSENVPRPIENGAYSTKAELPILMVAPNIYDMQNKSLVERARPHEDELNLLNLKIQQHLIQAKPPGVAINKESLSDIMLGHGQEAAMPEDIYKMYAQTGSFVYSDVRDNGEIINGKPIEFLENGVGRDFAILVNAYREAMQKINDVIGFNPAVDGSMPDAETAVGNAKLAVNATNNALRPLYKYSVRLIERCSKGVAIMIQDSVKYNWEAFSRSIGESATEVLKYGQKLALHQYGIKIEMLPDEEEKMNLQGYIQRGIDALTLTAGDAFDVEEQMKSDVKLARQLLVLREEKNRRNAAAQKKAEIEYNGQVQVQSGQAVAMAQADTEERIAASKAQLIALEKNLDDRNADKQHYRTMEQIREKSRGAVDVAEVKTTGELRSNAFSHALDSENSERV